FAVSSRLQRLQRSPLFPYTTLFRSGKSDEAVSYEKMKEKVNDALKQHFRPEFLNRIDETIVFHELSKPEITQIVDLMVRRTSVQDRKSTRLNSSHVAISYAVFCLKK